MRELEKQGIRPSPPADRRTIQRRVYLDLTGLPPTPEEVEAFLQDESADAYARVVDDLLSRPQYGERWARHWLDTARYSDGLGGFGDNGPLPGAWRYRDWVVDCFNRDLPYDQFVKQQIAGDLYTEDPLAFYGTGFFAIGPNYKSDGGDPEAKAQAEAEGGDAGEDGETTSSASDDESGDGGETIVDADFEEVDDDNKKSEAG